MSDSVDSAVEVEKLKLEMKMLETALQGAARQAQAKADEIAKLHMLRIATCVLSNVHQGKL